MTDNLGDKQEAGRRGGEKEKPFTMKSWDDLRHELRTMKPRSKLYETVKDEISGRGHWKAKPRGDGFKKGYDERRDIEPLKK